MKSSILSLATAVPKYQVDQIFFAESLANRLNLPELESKKLKKIFQNTKIEKRHSVIPDYESNSLQGVLYDELFPENLPGSLKRNQIYKREAPRLAHQAAQKALNQWGGSADSISHVISVSCTGMMAPGIEFQLIDSLGLKKNTTRLGINFMGCFGAFQGLDTAAAFAMANPRNRVLLVCTELCSLHMQPSADLSKIVSNALFADGAAAAIVGGNASTNEVSSWEIVRKNSVAINQTQKEMTWELGNDGFLMELTDRVPKEIEKEIKPFVTRLLQDDLSFEQCEWLVHPGGKAILESISRVCDLKDDLNPSWSVMKEYGNMSSATFLFVLEKAMKNKDYAIGVGFGPGLSIEGILLKNAYA